MNANEKTKLFHERDLEIAEIKSWFHDRKSGLISNDEFKHGVAYALSVARSQKSRLLEKIFASLYLGLENQALAYLSDYETLKDIQAEEKTEIA